MGALQQWLISSVNLLLASSVVAFNSLLIVLLILPWYLLSPLLPRVFYRKIIKFLQEAFVETLLFLFWIFCPFSLVVRCPAGMASLMTSRSASRGALKSNSFAHPTVDQKAVIIANHQTYLDWVFVWFFTYLFDFHGNVKISMKQDLQYLPIIGQARNLLKRQRGLFF